MDINWWMVSTGVLAYVAIGGAIAVLVPSDPWSHRSDFGERVLIGAIWPIVPFVLLAYAVLGIAKARCEEIIRRKRG